MTKQQCLRTLPKMDDLLRAIESEASDLPRNLIKSVIQEELGRYRESLVAGKRDYCNQEELLTGIRLELKRQSQPHLRGVVNATGVILHTNLGRARLSEECADMLASVGCRYSNLEYDLDDGSRGSRYQHVEDLLIRLTGAEAALIVNNNAAAVYLVLDSITKGREVVVSRGELVEIGGSFRVPNIMAASGCKLVEVGTTNKTHPSDYIDAISEHTGALLKVHTSNYKIIGFTEEVEMPELAEIARKNQLPSFYDLGSGLMVDLAPYGIAGEMTVEQCVRQGADLVCFSGDKLLGGPQAGIIVGKSAYIAAMKKNHLLRALRIDKLTLTALEITLRQYLDPAKAVKSIPTLRMIAQTLAVVREKAEQLASLLAEVGCRCSVVRSAARVGGGSLPAVELESYAVAIHMEELSPNRLETKLRENSIPIIARIADDCLQLDLRTIEPEEFADIVLCLKKIISDLRIEL
ncbi:L-seryl-tRNA(Sec) selenium transferase [Sporomusa sp. KB1]|jgi:L-seryl-tRNA(Ser) seleniumtransferase|uniref:L-seryl-tRNA(Sec) selenium transferase n=1 Tax=Sporomusa sp. KB1 TaxID=943346 RepID=UPI0011A7F330|nr:L-seryl-tRNA(Sec) selenium transferase [Sporomusa sp. KB1]TWH47259.1 L-seryl-tRNA(Sec) selenium transferase [Sporomusa sp. KB1]